MRTESKIAELKVKQAEQLANLETTETIRAALQGVPGVKLEDVSICLHDRKHPHASVKLWADFRTARPLIDAVKVVAHFKDHIIEGEHWKSGCVSTWPEVINSCIKDKGAVMDGSHAVEIEVAGGRGYGPDVSIQFWTRIAGMLCEVTCPVAGLWKLIPAVKGRYDQEGNFRGKIEWNPIHTQTVDKFRSFWSEPPSFKGSYYLAGVPNFMAWVSQTCSREEMAQINP